ncbi:MAG: hypothetical protein ABJP45_07420 [Cyclobacteriaceae bacterium]
MKAILSVLSVLPALAFCQTQTSGQMMEKGWKKYSVEQGSITYTISGDASGSEVFTFDRYGWRSLKKISMEFELYGAQRSQVLHETSDGGSIYRIDHSDSTYSKRIDFRWTTQASQVSPKQASEAILFSLGGTYASDSVLLGKTCQVWTFENKALKQMWIWNGLALKRVSKLGENNIITTATEVNLQPAIDATIFRVPTTYKLKE